jgi:hypothetical protein
MPPGKITMEKPSASRSAAAVIGVAPPSTMLAISGARPAKVRRCGQFLARARRLDEQHVGAGLEIGLGPVERGVDPLHRDGVGAGDDQRLVAARARRPWRAILPAISAGGISDLSARWPQRLG